MNNQFKLNKITIAISNINEMVNFYKIVFNCNFKEIEVYNSTLYSSQLFGVGLLLCPNEIAGVKAEQNRQQFNIEVTNIEDVLQNVINAKGSIKEPYNSETKTASIIDPDENTIVFIQAT